MTLPPAMRLLHHLSLRFLPWISVVFLGCADTVSVGLRWEPTGGPLAQNVTFVLGNPKLTGNLLACLSTGDVYTSPDGGTHWQHLSSIGPWTRVNDMARDPENPDILYAATDRGMRISRTRGQSWASSGNGLPHDASCQVIAVDPWKPERLFAGIAGHGLFRSTDGAASWQQIGAGSSATGADEVDDIAFGIGKPNILYVALRSADLVTSTDGGDTWRRITEEQLPSNTVITHVVVHPKKPGVLVAATETGTLYRSTDDGGSWIVTRRESEGWRILTLEVDTREPEVIYAGTESGILRSSDFGASWSRPLSTLPPLPSPVALVSSNGPSLVVVYGAGIGVQASSDGGTTWRHVDEGLGGSTIPLVTTDPAGSGVYAAVGAALMRYDAPSGSWLPASTGIVGGGITSVAFDPENPAMMYATTARGAFRSVNRGERWTPITQSMRMSPRYLETHPTYKTRVLGSGSHGSFMSTDRGNSWFFTKPQGNGISFHQLTFTPTNAGIIHAASGAQGVHITVDGGLTWEPARYGLSADTILAVTLDDQDALTYFAWSAAGRCFRSTNKGLEWSNYVPPWKTGDRVLVAFDRTAPSSLVALVNGEDVLYSPSGGTSWLPIMRGGEHHDALSMHWNAKSGKVYIGTRENGVFWYNLGPIVREFLEE